MRAGDITSSISRPIWPAEVLHAQSRGRQGAKGARDWGPARDDKFILVDPLSKRPIVGTGTANFSGPSQATNDENMLAIPADARVADIYFGEFMRVFDHFYARYIVGVMQEKGTGDSKTGFLKEKMEDWLPAHFKVGGRKDLRRRYFMEE